METKIIAMRNDQPGLQPVPIWEGDLFSELVPIVGEFIGKYLVLSVTVHRSLTSSDSQLLLAYLMFQGQDY